MICCLSDKWWRVLQATLKSVGAHKHLLDSKIIDYACVWPKLCTCTPGLKSLELQPEHYLSFACPLALIALTQVPSWTHAPGGNLVEPVQCKAN